MEAYKQRSSVWKIFPSKKQRFEKQKKDNSPSPLSYHNDTSFDFITLKNSSFQIPKSKCMNFFEKIVKSKLYLPSVGSYDTYKGENKVTRGARTSYR